MPSEFSLAVVAPDREVLEISATSVILPGALGYFGVYGGHEPMIVALSEGNMTYVETNGFPKELSIRGGFAEVTQTRVTVLADSVPIQ